MAACRRQWRDYRTAAGNRPVRAFLLLRGDIWEVRVDGERLSFRVLFAPEGRFGQVLLALEAFVKKTQRTPPTALELAEARLRDWRSRGGRAG